MASDGGENPNETIMNDDVQQVMSPSGAQASPQEPLPRDALPNGVPLPPPRSQYDMDGETTTAVRMGTAPRVTGPTQVTPLPAEAAPGSTDTEVPSSSRATISSASVRGFLQGPQAGTQRMTLGGPEVTGRGQGSFLGGVAKAVQAIPAAVEGLLGNTSAGPTTQDVHSGSTGGFVSANSGSPERVSQGLPAAPAPSTPLLDERTLQRLNGLQTAAPHLYAPEAPSSGVKPPSTTSSDIQAEVRRQVQEFMIQRDEENRELRTRVELLMSENRTLRQEISDQVYSREQPPRPVEPGRFSRLEWLGRGFGNLVSGVTSPKPTSPPKRLMDLRPPPPPPTTSTLPPSTANTHPRPEPVSAPDGPEERTASGFRVGASGSELGSSGATARPSTEPWASTARALDFGPAEIRDQGPDEPLPVIPEASANDPMSVVLTGMAQLQGVVADLANSPKQVRQEVIKPGVNSLPELPSVGAESCLQFADWIHASKPALSDVSDTSEELWMLVLKEAKDWYARYLRLDAVSKLTSKPVPSEDVTQAKWARVSRRIETMIIAACPTSVREELSAARVTGLLAVVARLYVIYAPGGLNEREIGLRHIQDPSSGTTVKDTVDLLRKWSRWCDRMVELGGTLPDSALRVKALEKITRVVLQSNPDVAFRINLTRAALQIDSTPDDTKVTQLHAQMLGELETIVHRTGSKDHDKTPKDTLPAGGAKVRGVEDSPKNQKGGKGNAKGSPNPKQAVGTEGTNPTNNPCTFFTSPGGCKTGAECTFTHNWSSIPAAERPQRCRNCGAKGHRASECKAGTKGEEKAKNKAPSANPKGPTNPKTSQPGAANTATASPPTKEMSQQQIKSMLADAAQILQQAVPSPKSVQQAVPISAAPTPGAPPPVGTTAVTQGTPVTLESLNAQIDSLRAMAQEHEVRMIGIVAEGTPGKGEQEGQVKALLDSGATHAVIPYSNEMGSLERVGVTLAGDSKEEWFKTSGGTLVIPPPVDDKHVDRPQTILPFGALVETLGCKVSWSKRKGLKVTHPRLGPLKVGVSPNTCPYVQEDQALRLIAELESQRLRDFERSVQAMEAELHEIANPGEPTEALRKFIRTGKRGPLLKAVFAQPYLRTVPEAVKVRLCEELPGVTDEDGWNLLKRLPLSRARRRALHSSREWLVYLCSGATKEGDPLKLWAQSKGLEFLGVDIKEQGGQGWDLSAELRVWSVLLWAAAQGRITIVLSSPPYRTWNHAGSNASNRSIEDPWGCSSSDPLVIRESLLAVQDLLLWSIASTARGQAIPFLKEIPSTSAATSLHNSQRLTPEVFWTTEVWKEFQHWAKVDKFVFCQGSLGHEWLRPSVVGTNLTLKHLQGMPRVGDPSPPACTEPNYSADSWCKGFKKEVIEALEGRVKGTTVEELDRIISNSQSRVAGASDSLDSSSSEAPDDGAEESLVQENKATGDAGDEAEVSALKSADREAWRAHIMRGHLPYRRDCQFCVEGAGLGVQHRKVKTPQAYTLSVDLFGPMPPLEKGRDEQSVSGNPHLRFGLVGVYRMPRSMLATKFQPPPEEEKKGEDDPFKELPGSPGEYEPTDPGDEADGALLQDMAELFSSSSLPVEAKALDAQPASEIGDPVINLDPLDDSQGLEDEYEWLDDDKLDQELKEVRSKVDLVTLRFFVGLKSKTGPDVTAGIQQLVLRITQQFPLRILHCDPGTEFASDSLARWLPGQGVKLQTTIPTDKQGNGLAERIVGWFKSRARTLLSANSLPASLWPLAMRWASESHNRSVLQQEPLPAFGQTVLHKLKRPSGAHKELLTRWVKAIYGAPHLTVTDGHVLITPEGNLVASKGFRTGIADPKILEEALPPPIQELEGSEVAPVEEEVAGSGIPERRIREKTSVRFLEPDEVDSSPDAIAEKCLESGDFTDEKFRAIVTALEGTESATTDRRGDFEGRFILGAYCHGGKRGVTTLCKQNPSLTLFLNKFLRSKLVDADLSAEWASLLLMHAADVPLHRDFRNEWGTHNFALCVPGNTELWLGPPHNPKDQPSAPEWDSTDVVSLLNEVRAFDPRNYHAVRKNPDWVIVGCSPLGVHKLEEEDKELLNHRGFNLPRKIPEVEPQIKAFRPTRTAGASSSSQSAPPEVQGPLSEDEQPDANTQLVAWDLSGGATRNQPSGHTLPRDLNLFLWERDIQRVLPELQRLGIEEPEDLVYLFVEDLIEFGLSRWEAERVMFGVHPPGTRRPDNPNICGTRTGEVRLFDRDSQQIPWVFQNRTLAQSRPDPPLPNLGVRTDNSQSASSRTPWHQPQPEATPEEEPPQEARVEDTYYHGCWEDEWIPSTGPTAASSSTQPPQVSTYDPWEHEWTTPPISPHVAQPDELGPETGITEPYEPPPWTQATDVDPEYEEPPWAQAQPPTQSTGNDPWSRYIATASASQERARTLLARPPGLDPPSDRNPSVRMVQVDVEDNDELRDPCRDKGRGIGPLACRVTPLDVFSVSEHRPQLDVHFPSVITAQTQDRTEGMPDPQAAKVVENSFTPNVEDLLAKLTGPLEVVHQVSPAEVKRHLDKWKNAALEELNSLEGMQAIRRHKGSSAHKLAHDSDVEVLPAKCVFTVKPGKPFRRKVRVVSCGNYATGVSEDILYASGAAAETLRIALVRAGSMRHSAWATDIKNAFLLAPIPSTSTRRYALRPPAILILLGICEPNEVWEVCKALYGFREAPKWWAGFRDETLLTASFTVSGGVARLQRTTSDDNLWRIVGQDDSILGHVLVYVDDLLILSTLPVARALHDWIKGRWQCSELERAQRHRALRFLGVDVYEVQDDQGPCGFKLGQEGYIDELVRSHELAASCRASVPVPKEWVREAPADEVGYSERALRDAQRITGELLWISQRTRLDVVFCVGLMSSWASRAPQFVKKVGLRVLAYLANTKTLRLTLVPDKDDLELQVFTDASFAPYGERSISGITVQLGNQSVFWKSRRQSLVSLSTAECELIAACEGVVLAQSVQALAEELYSIGLKVTLRVDNVAAITLAEGGGSQRTRHLRVRASFLKEMIEKKTLQVRHCPGEQQLADALTKALPAPRLEYLNQLLGIAVPDDDDPSVQAVAAASRCFRNIDCTQEGQGLVLVMALLMMQVQPANSQEEEEREPVDLDLYVVAVMMAFSVLFVWELGKHCLRQCLQSSEVRVAAVRSTEDEDRRQRRQETIRRALERETDEGLRRRQERSGVEAEGEPSAPSGKQATPPPQVHVHVSTPSTAEVTSQSISSSSSSSHRPTWTLVRPPTPPIPVPPPLPPRETEDRSRRNQQGSREIGVQTDGPQGLPDSQLCEIEVITSSARTPGVLHLFPDCHVLRTVSSTHRRTFCRYCLMTLRQRGMRG